MYTFTTSSYLYPFSVYVTIHTFSWIATEKKNICFKWYCQPYIYICIAHLPNVIQSQIPDISPGGQSDDFVCRGGGVQGLFLMTLLCIKFYRGGGCPPDSPLDPCMSLEIFSILFEWKGLIFERNNVYIVTILFEVQWPSGVGYNSFWEKIFSLIVF